MPNDEIEGYRYALEYALGIPFSGGNRLTALQNGREIFPAMLAAIQRAEHRIDFATYVYWTGDIAENFAQALAAAATRGVRVRVLLDSFGARPIEKQHLQTLSASNVDVRWFRPLKTFRIWRIDKRTHRKILVCDEKVAFTGGVGIADEWTGDARHPDEWRDMHLRLEGPAVAALRAAFADNWNEAGEWDWDRPLARPEKHSGGVPVQVVRSASTIGWTAMAAVLRSLVAVARSRLRIVTAYFVPDPAMLRQIKNAVARGVSVEILIPGRFTDSRLSQLAGHHATEQLLALGVSVFRYQKTMLHTKLILVDDLVCCIGSPNMNHRSMGKDEECCVVSLGPELVATLAAEFDNDCTVAEMLEYSAWSNRGGLLKLREQLARILIEQL